jgi:hypothetical protein
MGMFASQFTLDGRGGDVLSGVQLSSRQVGESVGRAVMVGGRLVWIVSFGLVRAAVCSAHGSDTCGDVHDAQAAIRLLPNAQFVRVLADGAKPDGKVGESTYPAPGPLPASASLGGLSSGAGGAPGSPSAGASRASSTILPIGGLSVSTTSNSSTPRPRRPYTTTPPFLIPKTVLVPA